VNQQQEPNWQPTRRQLLWAGGIAALVFLIIVICGYVFGWKWTGLPKRTLWDWLDLLIVPVVLAIGGYLFTLSDSRRTRDQADHRREEDVLQAYLDQMWQLLLNKDLRSTSKANSNSEALTAARVSTLTTLERIHHADKKRLIVTFLWMWQRSLLKRQDTVVILEGGANLGGADLHEVDLGGADLKGAKLEGANLREANLREANLSGALEWTEEQLSEARSLEGATMPDGQILKSDDNPNRPTFEEWLKSQGRQEDG
jgi:hypothetical protein